MAQARLIICNTSPLINLAEIGRLDLLVKIFGRVCIPPAVRDMASANGLPFTGTLGILAEAKARGDVTASDFLS